VEQGGAQRSLTCSGGAKKISSSRSDCWSDWSVLRQFGPFLKMWRQDIQRTRGTPRRRFDQGGGRQPIQWMGRFTEHIRVRTANQWPDVERKGRRCIWCDSASDEQRRGETVYQIGVLPHDETAYKRVSFPEGARYASLVTVERSRDSGHRREIGSVDVYR